MFSREVYVKRRQALKNGVKSGLLLFLGNEESPINYAANQYPFRQDSSFLYYWGLNLPGLAAILDIDEGTETIFGDDPSVADIVWTGPQPLLRDQAEAVGAGQAWPTARLKEHVMAAGLKQLGLMRGNVEEAVAAGAHAMFFQCGFGHMMGLDVHDMEDLGEQHVGYEGMTRNPQFGLCYLRLAKPLRAGFVATVEPGIYFIPELIDQWKAERKHEQFLNYDAIEGWRDFGGVRVEDDVVVTETGYRLLGKPVPITIQEVEAACAG